MIAQCKHRKMNLISGRNTTFIIIVNFIDILLQYSGNSSLDRTLFGVSIGRKNMS